MKTFRYTITVLAVGGAILQYILSEDSIMNAVAVLGYLTVWSLLINMDFTNK